MPSPARFAALLLILLFAPLLRAQETPQYEVFAGASYSRQDITDIRFINGIGWHAEAVGNAYSWLGAVFDFSGQYSSPNFTLLQSPLVVVTPHTSSYSYLFGPRFTYRHFQHFTPFAEALFGVENFKFTADVKVDGVLVANLGTPISSNAFATGLGGGVDVPVNSRFAIRLLQVDYIPTRFRELVFDPTTNTLAFSGPKRTQQNLRASIGFVVRFGSR